MPATFFIIKEITDLHMVLFWKEQANVKMP